MDVALRGERTVPGRALVVGAGPVGLVTALLLRSAGLAVDVVDHAPGPVGQSRATDLHAASLEGLEPYGVTADLLRIGTPVRRVVVWTDGRRRAEVPLGRPGSPFPFGLTVPQCTTEGLLQEHLAERGTTVRRRVQLCDLHDDGDRVRCELEGPDGRGSADYDWVFGCDGAGSTVRARAGIGWGGRTLPGTLAIADLEMDLPFPADEVHLRLAGTGSVHVLPMPVPGYVRLLLDRWPGPPAASPSAEQVADVARDRLGLPGAELRGSRWTSTFAVHRRLADSMRRGRVVLVGDAAHLVSPVGGQGLNLGVADALALAPLVVAVQAGHAPASALDVVARRRRARALRTGHLSALATWTSRADGAGAALRSASAPLIGTRLGRAATASWLAGRW